MLRVERDRHRRGLLLKLKVSLKNAQIQRAQTWYWHLRWQVDLHREDMGPGVQTSDPGQDPRSDPHPLQGG